MLALSSSARSSNQAAEIGVMWRQPFDGGEVSDLLRSGICAAEAVRTQTDMADFTPFSALRAACLDLPGGSAAASAAVARREATLTKPPGSLGRLEELAGWLAHWQGRAPPRLDT